MVYQIDEFLGLLMAVAALALLARKITTPYPILLVLGGLALAVLMEFFPRAPKIRLDPEIVFLLFLPPLLFSPALFTSWRDFKANLRPILLLAVGLVLFTTVCVGYYAHYLVPILPLSAAFVLGAIISPPDAVAATAITERLHVHRRLVTIIEGESLVNDAIALVTYEFAVHAMVTGSFSLAQASWKVVVVSLGGILIGLVVGWVASRVQSRLDDPPVQITISLLTPFAAYLPADQLGVSGVLAVVTAGLFLGWRSPEILGSRVRLQSGPVWEMIEFLLNGIVFILIGLELPDIWSTLAAQPVPKMRLIGDALLISAMVIVVRFIWVFLAAYLPRWFSKKLRERDPYPSWQALVLISWTGMRGVISLAAALAVPSMLPADHPSELDVNLALIIFFTYVVILVTLVLQGLTLPLLIRWLKVSDTGETDREERHARLKANLAANARLAEFEEREQFPRELLDRLRAEYDDRIRQLEAGDAGDGAMEHRGLFSSEYEALQQEALNVERSVIIRLRNERVINDIALRRIQHDIDLAEARLRSEG